MRDEGTPPDRAWERYQRLNAAIAKEVFEEGAAGQPVYLDLEPEVLRRIAKRMGETLTTEPDELLCKVVRATLPDSRDSAGLFHMHVALTRKWELEGSPSPPPCIGVLAVLSLVAERMKRTERFAGSNYYGPLLEALDIDTEHRRRVERGFREQTPQLWNALNRWLEEANGRRGLPTAVAFDHRRFIGLPLSQALVRMQDRARLPVLFAQFGLQAGQRISVQDMRELLGDWIPGSQVTPSLKRLWSKESNRERIAEVVCAELEAWDGTVPTELKLREHKQDDNLFLAAELTAHPSPSIDLLLLARRGSQGDGRSVFLSTRASGAAMTALAGLGEGIRLLPIPAQTGSR